MAVDSQRTGKETGFVSGRGAGRRGVVETGGRGHIPVTTYADGTPVPGAISPRPVADLRGSVTPGSNQPAADNKGEGIQMQIAERHRPGAGYPAGVQRPGDYPTRNTAPPNPNPDPTIPAKGTLTGGSVSVTPFDMDGFMKNIATPQGVNMRNRFASHQASEHLPGNQHQGGNDQHDPLPHLRLYCQLLAP